MKRVWLAIVSILVFVAMAEGAVRLLRPDLRLPVPSTGLRFDQTAELDKPLHARDPELGWRLTPNTAATVHVEGGSRAAFTTNDHGFRGDPFESYKQPGTYRVLVIGDSNAMGFGVGDDAIYAVGVEQLLGRLWQPRGVDVEVINLAVEGYSSHQARLVLDRYGPDLEPDAVIVQVGFNDHCGAPIADKDHSYERPALLNALEASHAYRWFRRQLLTASGAHERKFRPVARVSPDQYRENLAHMLDRCREWDATAIVVGTTLRPNAPLTLNEVPIAADGDTTWVTQDRVVDNAEADAGLELPRDALTTDNRDMLEALAAEHPSWPLPGYFLEGWYRATGDSATAATWATTWRSHDTERDLFATYMDVARSVTAKSDAVWLDGEAVLARTASQRGLSGIGPFFFDFVHVDEQGHNALARQIAHELDTRAR